MTFEGNYYELLQVREDASPEVIRSSYRTLMKKYHPDRAGEGGEEIARQLTQAEEVLTDPARRAEYDRTLRQRRREDERREAGPAHSPTPPADDVVEDAEFRDEWGHEVTDPFRYQQPFQQPPPRYQSPDYIPSPHYYRPFSFIAQTHVLDTHLSGKEMAWGPHQASRITGFIWAALVLLLFPAISVSVSLAEGNNFFVIALNALLFFAIARLGYAIAKHRIETQTLVRYCLFLAAIVVCSLVFLPSTPLNAVLIAVPVPFYVHAVESRRRAAWAKLKK